MLVKKQHLLASLRKTERNIFVPSGLVTGVFEELPQTFVLDYENLLSPDCAQEVRTLIDMGRKNRSINWWLL